jgi:hypothetical protein
MSFFPNLTPYIDDVHTTQSIKNKLSSDVAKVPYVGYYPNKNVVNFPKKSTHIDNINKVCAKTNSGNDTWKCKYTAVKIGTNGTDTTDPATIKNNLISAFQANNNSKRMDLSFLNHIDNTNFVCQLPNILIMLGYKLNNTGNTDNTTDKYMYLGNDVTYPVLYLKKRVETTTDSSSPSNNQTLFNACQTVMSQSRMYDSDALSPEKSINLMTFFTNPKLKALKPLFIGLLAITVYLLVQGTLSSFDLGFNISSIISSRSIPSNTFLMGAFIGILIPMILSIIITRQQIDHTNIKYSTYDVSTTPYGTNIESGSKSKENDKGMMVGLIVTIYFFIGVIYYIIRRKESSVFTKLGISFILFLFLTTVLFITFYWIPILSFGSDNNDDTVYGIASNLRVWLTGKDQRDINQVTSNKYIGYYLQRFFAMYALVTLVITFFYISRPMKPVTGFSSSILEGLMASCAILALPILWIFNWVIGMKYFVGYPMILLLVRFFRYPMYYIFRSQYLGSSILQARNPKLRAEFDKPQNYTAPWDLLGLTIFKFLVKMNGNKSLYSEMFVDPSNGYKDISSNSYVTGHIFRMGMKQTPGKNDYIHHIMTFIISVIVMIFLLFGVIGKKNLS